MTQLEAEILDIGSWQGFWEIQDLCLKLAFLVNLDRWQVAQKDVERVRKHVFENVVGVERFLRVNRAFLMGEAGLGDLFSGVQGLGGMVDEIKKEANVESLIHKVKNNKFDIRQFTQSSDIAFETIKKNLKQQKEKLTNKKNEDISQYDLKIYTNLLLLYIPSLETNSNKYITTDELVIQLLITVTNSMSLSFIQQNTELFEHLTTTLYHTKVTNSISLLHYRIKEIQKSPYELLEPFIIQNWEDGDFTGIRPN